MVNVDPSLLAVVEGLPSAHRRHLESHFSKYIPAGSTQRQKYQIIAQRIGPRDINRYDRLYLPGNGLSFVWYTIPDVASHLPALETHLLGRFGPALANEGLHPDLLPNEDPKIHKMISHSNRLELIFGRRENDRRVFRNWTDVAVESDHLFHVVIRRSPFTVEVRAPFRSYQDALMRSLSTALDMDFSSAIRCTLDTEEIRDQLEANLPAELFGSRDRGKGLGLASSRTYSDDTTPLRLQRDFIEQRAHEHRELTYLEYRFRTKHQYDDYEEVAEYGVNLQSGDLHAGKTISETALERLRKDVVKLYQPS